MVLAAKPDDSGGPFFPAAVGRDDFDSERPLTDAAGRRTARAPGAAAPAGRESPCYCAPSWTSSASWSEIPGEPDAVAGVVVDAAPLGVKKPDREPSFD